MVYSHIDLLILIEAFRHLLQYTPPDLNHSVSRTYMWRSESHCALW